MGGFVWVWKGSAAFQLAVGAGVAAKQAAAATRPYSAASTPKNPPSCSHHHSAAGQEIDELGEERLAILQTKCAQRAGHSR